MPKKGTIEKARRETKVPGKRANEPAPTTGRKSARTKKRSGEASTQGKGNGKSQTKQDSKRTEARLVEKALKSFGTKFEKGLVKGTLADFMRLLQIRKEFEGDEPKEIRVTWIEPETH